LEREERMMMTEEPNEDSSSCCGPVNASAGEGAPAGQLGLLANDDTLVSQDSCSEESPNGLLKVSLQIYNI
jgi:hypothetical protein